MNALRFSTLALVLGSSATVFAKPFALPQMPWQIPSLLRDPGEGEPGQPSDPGTAPIPIRHNRVRTVIKRTLVTCSQTPLGVECTAELSGTPMCRMEYLAPVYDVRDESRGILQENVRCSSHTGEQGTLNIRISTYGYIFSGEDPFEPGRRTDFLSWGSMFDVDRTVPPSKPGEEPLTYYVDFGGGSLTSRDLSSANVIIDLLGNERSWENRVLPPGEMTKTYEFYWGQTEVLGPQQ